MVKMPDPDRAIVPEWDGPTADLPVAHREPWFEPATGGGGVNPGDWSRLWAVVEDLEARVTVLEAADEDETNRGVT